VGLAHRAGVRASELTLSERRKLEVGRALAMDPTVVLLDEVMAGLNQSEVDDMIGLIQRLHQRGLTLLIIEHNLKVVRSFAERVIVLDRGAKIAEGGAEAILSSPAVVKAYLGDRRK
ncbi:ABC transporter ATP-binding protein C-terminal domain-containing protein, partial [Roseateles sp. GG27B]